MRRKDRHEKAPQKDRPEGPRYTSIEADDPEILIRSHAQIEKTEGPSRQGAISLGVSMAPIDQREQEPLASIKARSRR